MFRVCLIADNTKASTQVVGVLLLSARSLVQILVQRLAMLPEVLTVVIRQPSQIPLQYLKLGPTSCCHIISSSLLTNHPNMGCYIMLGI